MMIAIKNSKDSYDCQDWAYVKRSDTKELIAVIIRFPEVTYRKSYSGTNDWDCFNIFTEEGYVSKTSTYYKGDATEDIKNVSLGKRDGETIGVSFNKLYTSTFGNTYAVPIPIEVEWMSDQKGLAKEACNFIHYQGDPFAYKWGGKERSIIFTEETIEPPRKRGRDRLVQTEEDAPIEPFLPNE